MDKQQELISLLEPSIVGEGYELIELQWRPERGGWVLRLLIDSKQGGVTLGDCQKISLLAGRRLDEAGWEGPSYTLEVSSPGIDRPLRKLEDFARFSGKRVRIQVRRAVDDTEQRVFVGVIEVAQAGKVCFRDSAGSHSLDFNDIAKANLEPEF
ncbi:MAG: ribosome maturation factor RimP [Elusimicrobiota bacterium]